MRADASRKNWLDWNCSRDQLIDMVVALENLAAELQAEIDEAEQ